MTLSENKMSATDIIAVHHPNGVIKCSPFCVRFGKKQKSRHIITVFVNGKQIINECGWSLVVDAGELFAKFVKMESFEDKEIVRRRKR